MNIKKLQFYHFCTCKDYHRACNFRKEPTLWVIHTQCKIFQMKMHGDLEGLCRSYLKCEEIGSLKVYYMNEQEQFEIGFRTAVLLSKEESEHGQKILRRLLFGDF